MGTIPSEFGKVLGAESAVALRSEEEEASFLPVFSPATLPEGEWTGHLLIEEEEKDGKEGEEVRTGTTMENQIEPTEEEPSHNFTMGSREASLDESGTNSEESLPSLTKEVLDKTRFAIGEESCTSGSRQELPLVEDREGMEPLYLLANQVPGPGSAAQGASGHSCCIQAEDATSEEEECPICTEPYDQDGHQPALLNCNHALCGQCLQAIMEAASAADIGRVRCPICRQKTPMMEWEICKLQEELLLLSSAQGPALVPPATRALPARRPGFWGALEHHFLVRFHTTRVIGFFPCLRYPTCLISGLARLEHHCHCCYQMVLLALAAAEMLSLFLVFLPIILLLLLFLILDK